MSEATKEKQKEVVDCVGDSYFDDVTDEDLDKVYMRFSLSVVSSVGMHVQFQIIIWLNLILIVKVDVFADFSEDGKC